MNRITTHDETVTQLAGALSALFRQQARHTVLTNSRWQPMEEFPDCIETFDILIVPTGSPMATSGTVSAPPRLSPTTIIDVVSRETWKDAFYSRTDFLLRSGVYEYVLYDPSGEWLRPSLQAFRKGDSGWKTFSICAGGVWFCHLNFRLDVREGAPVVFACKNYWLEEQLMERRVRRERMILDANTTPEALASMDESIRKWEIDVANSPGRKRAVDELEDEE